MEPVVIISDGLATRALEEALRNAGSPAVIIGAGPSLSVRRATEMTLALNATLVELPAVLGTQMHNPRPYLKRKKGRV